MRMSMHLLAEATQHVVIKADWIDWVIVVSLLPMIAFCYQLWISRGNKIPEPRQAFLYSLPPLALALLTAGFIWIRHGTDAVTEFGAGFIVELTLSFDNVFAWYLIVSAFVLWRGYHMWLVVWGVAIAIVLRIIVLTVGQGLLAAVWPISILLFALLVKLGWNFLKNIFATEDEDTDPTKTGVYRAITKVVNISEARYGTHLFTREEGGFKITVFGLAVACLGGLDLMFATDSIPAILAIAHDPFIIISSNVLAVLFLQSLYFLYEAVEQHLTRIKWVLPFIMWFVAVKILWSSRLFDWLGEHLSWWPIKSHDISAVHSIEIILGLLIIGGLWSYFQPEKNKAAEVNTEPAATPIAA